jgi:hypothetical protein
MPGAIRACRWGGLVHKWHRDGFDAEAREVVWALRIVLLFPGRIDASSPKDRSLARAGALHPAWRPGYVLILREGFD